MKKKTVKKEKVEKATEKKTSTTKSTIKKNPKKEKAIELYREGLTITKICKLVKVNRTTFYLWLKDDSFRQAREDIDNDLVQIAKVGLAKRAEGYFFNETKKTIENGVETKIEVTEKHLPPDVGACAFILKTKGGYREQIEIDHPTTTITLPGRKI